MSALQAYRALLRASRLAFQGDSTLLAASHREIRTQFERSRDAAASPDDAPPSDKIKHAFEVATYLRRNVVQAVKTDGDEVFRLRIHDETERGDNESIKTPLKGRVGRIETCS
ncbi:Mitochondrial zinc maintenance protein 1, mitochondrial [Orbilia brochopaga]|uniref:Mitochondrial zinc maintenance protein 1, mitochondrial n=1 Tax=Orbilia brochopaga TaxID=3140254 RepID=A0AAV9UH49_9PEZI